MRMPFGRVHSALIVPIGSGKRDDVLDALRHRLDAFRVERQTIQQRARHAPVLRTLHIEPIRLENPCAPRPDLLCRSRECCVLRGRRGLAQRVRRTNGRTAERFHDGGNFVGGMGRGVHAAIMDGGWTRGKTAVDLAGLGGRDVSIAQFALQNLADRAAGERRQDLDRGQALRLAQPFVRP